MATELPAVSVEDVLGYYSNIPENKFPEVEVAVKTAELMVKSALIDTGCGANYSDDQLKAIIGLLAAHNYQIQTGVLSSIQAGSASESYQMNTDFFLKGTLHGQQAMLLDPNHCLAQLQADTQAALDGKQSYPPSVVSLHSNKQKGRRRNCGCNR